MHKSDTHKKLHLALRAKVGQEPDSPKPNPDASLTQQRHNAGGSEKAKVMLVIFKLS